MSGFACAAHSLHSLISVSLAPGTQWSQKPTLSLPAAYAPCTKGAASAVALAAAAVVSTVRRVGDIFPMFPLLFDGPVDPAFPSPAGSAGLRNITQTKRKAIGFSRFPVARRRPGSREAPGTN